ncbi:MAG: DnaD domain protein [Clostridia bacterium]|nr:DnaD domain protein [Clostridia bacterium]
MRIEFSFGDRVAVLPAAITAHLHKATKKDMAILLTLAADPAAQLDLDAAVAAITARGEYTPAEIEGALAFWRGTGLVRTDGQATQPSATPAPDAPAPAVRVVAEKGLPSYSTEELTSILARREGLAQLLDDCQQAFGKIFNTSEIAIIAGLVDYLGLTGEYVLLLLTHCRSMEKKSLRYVEKMAITLHDEGVHGVRELEQRLQSIEIMASAAGRVRAIFGITARALTSKEKAMIERWVCEMKFDEGMLTRAYEMTVDTIGKPSMPYANKILERWFADGYKTVEDVDRALAEYKRKKNGGSSFDVDEFFEAALRRTYAK